MDQIDRAARERARELEELRAFQGRAIHFLALMQSSQCERAMQAPATRRELEQLTAEGMRQCIRRKQGGSDYKERDFAVWLEACEAFGVTKSLPIEQIRESFDHCYEDIQRKNDQNRS